MAAVALTPGQAAAAALNAQLAAKRPRMTLSWRQILRGIGLLAWVSFSVYMGGQHFRALVRPVATNQTWVMPRTPSPSPPACAPVAVVVASVFADADALASFPARRARALEILRAELSSNCSVQWVTLVAGSPRHPVVVSARANAPESSLLLQTLAALQPELGVPPNPWLLTCAQRSLQPELEVSPVELRFVACAPASDGLTVLDDRADANLVSATVAERVLYPDTLAKLRARLPAGRLVWVGDSEFGNFGADVRAVASWPTALAVTIVADNATAQSAQSAQSFTTLLAYAHGAGAGADVAASVADADDAASVADVAGVAGAIVVGSPGMRSYMDICWDSPQQDVIVLFGCLTHAAIRSAFARMGRDPAGYIIAGASNEVGLSSEGPSSLTVGSPRSVEHFLVPHAIVVAGCIGLSALILVLLPFRLMQGRVHDRMGWIIFMCTVWLAVSPGLIDLESSHRNCVVDGFCLCEDYVSPVFDRRVRLSFPAQEFRDRWVVLDAADAGVSSSLPACADLFAAQLTGRCQAGDRAAAVIEVSAGVRAEHYDGRQPAAGTDGREISGTCFEHRLRVETEEVLYLSGWFVMAAVALGPPILRHLAC